MFYIFLILYMVEVGNNKFDYQNENCAIISNQSNSLFGILDAIKDFKELIKTLYDDYFQENNIYNDFIEDEFIPKDLPVRLEYPEILSEYDNDQDLLKVFKEQVDNCGLPAKKCLLEHKNCPEFIKDYIKNSGTLKFDPFCLKFEDIEGAYDFDSLARLILYVKITGEKIHSHEDLHWKIVDTSDGWYLPDINASGLKFLFDYDIHINSDKLSSMSNIVIDGVKSFSDSVKGKIEFSPSMISFLISYFEGKEENYLIKNKISDICCGIFKLSDYLSEIDFSDHEIQNRLLNCKPEMFDENNLRFIFGCLIPQNCENPFDEFVACNYIIGKIICFREIVSEVCDKQLKIEFPEIINETRDNELKTRLNITETDESVQFGKFIARLELHFSKVDFSDPKILRELLTFCPEIFEEDNLDFFSKYFKNFNDGTYNSLFNFNQNIGNIVNYARLSHYLPEIDFSDPEIQNKLLKCKSEIFDENILKFIFKYIILNNYDNKFDKFVFLNEKYFDKIINFCSLLYADLDKDGNPVIFNRLKKWFPDIDSDPFKVQKLLNCKPEMFEEDNIGYILEHFIPQNCENLFDEFIACNADIDKIVRFRGIIMDNVYVNNQLEKLKNDDSILFEKFINLLNSYFSAVDFSDSENLKKLLYLNPEMFNKNNLDLFLKYNISDDSGPSFDDYIACNDIINEFSNINLSLLDLLIDRFGLKGNVMKELVEFRKTGDSRDRDEHFDLFYAKLSELVTFFDQYFFINGGEYNFKSLGLDIPSIYMLSVINSVEQLLYVDPGFDKSVLSEAKSIQDSKLENFARSFGKDIPFNSPDYGPFNDDEIQSLNVNQSEIDRCNAEISKIRGQIRALQCQVSEIEKQKRNFEKNVAYINEKPYHRYEKVMKAKNTQEQLEKGKRRERCKSFFKNGINEDNFRMIFEYYFDIVFDGKYNNFLQSIPESIIKRGDFMERVISLSLDVNSPHKIFPLIKRLYVIRKHNNVADDSYKLEILSALEYISNLMSAKGYFGSFIYGLISLSDNNHNLEFFSYVLSKYCNLKTCDKVKLLPYFSNIPFKSKDDLDQFIRDIVLEYGSMCLKPHYYVIANRYFDFGLSNYHPTYQRYDFRRCSADYYHDCLNNFLSEKIDISTIYSRGSGELRSEKGICGQQKFILGADIIDSQNIKCYLRTDDVEFHKQLNWRGACNLGGGFLYKDDLSKKIYVFGKSRDFGAVYLKFYPIIEDILRKEYPDYEVVFGNPDYYH